MYLLFAEEIRNYLMEPFPVDDDVLKYWRDRKAAYPQLHTVFTFLASIPATSAASVREFSKANNIITNKRSNINYEKVNRILILNSHLSKLYIRNEEPSV